MQGRLQACVCVCTSYINTYTSSYRSSELKIIRMWEYLLVLVHNLYLSHLNHCQVTLLYILFLQVALVVPLWDGKVRTYVRTYVICYCKCIHAIHMLLQHVVTCWCHKEMFHCTHTLCHGWHLACPWCHGELQKDTSWLACSDRGKTDLELLQKPGTSRS